MRKFDTTVQYMKYKALKEVARHSWKGDLAESILDIPKIIEPGITPITSCCIYKERAIFSERVKIAMGGDKSNPNIIEVMDIACNECPGVGYEVTNLCRGCLAHRCENSCKRGAIYFDKQHIAHIDKSKCVECGQCSKNCPFSAIIKMEPPCVKTCKVNAITRENHENAKIDYDKCIQCGSCVYQCPFGAIADKSYITNVISMLKESDGGKNFPVYALLAPSFASQFTFAKIGQFVSGLKKIGFSEILETALGADMVAESEAAELSEKGFLTTSCCPAFVKYIKTAFPELSEYVSHNPSPMAALSKYIKETDKNAKTVFIGPCTAKKAEAQLDNVNPYVDFVLTYEELLALIDSREIDLSSLPEESFDNASCFGRIFAYSGGVTTAAAESLKENHSDFEVNACVCDGIEACRVALLKKGKNMLDANFIEGMACLGGCINGAGCLTHSEKNHSEIDKYSNAASKKTIKESLENIK